MSNIVLIRTFNNNRKRQVSYSTLRDAERAARYIRLSPATKRCVVVSLEDAWKQAEPFYGPEREIASCTKPNPGSSRNLWLRLWAWLFIPR